MDSVKECFQRWSQKSISRQCWKTCAPSQPSHAIHTGWGALAFAPVYAGQAQKACSVLNLLAEDAEI